MDVPLIAAGLLALFAAAVHGGAGEMLVVRKLPQEALGRTRFGGPRMTMGMIHVAWHLTTVAFLAMAVALLLAGSVLDGDSARATARVAAGAFTGFALIAVGVGSGYMRSPRSLLGHPGPAVIALTAALAWWGAL